MDEVYLKLTLDEVNGILSALGMLSFSQVNNLALKIRDQAVVQLQKQKEQQQDEGEKPKSE